LIINDFVALRIRSHCFSKNVYLRLFAPNKKRWTTSGYRPAGTVVVMDVLYLNTMINYCKRKTILSGKRSPYNIFYSLLSVPSFYRRFLKLLGIFNFYLPKMPTGFTFRSEKMLISNIEARLISEMLLTDRKKNTSL